ncbi:ATP-binding protein [Ekhidna sp.]|uniref:hybrid sensor histidine kinase/response regulator n=1 Tax=Ekhidna sp. TaxID=2608089 RepID=UPI0032999669
MKRSRFPYILGTSLLVLTIGASFLGFFAYKNLNQIIGSLEDEVTPNVNLLLINNIAIELQNVEYAMERYVYTNEESNLDEFRDLIASSIRTLDTLRDQNNNPEMIARLDTLQNLILNKGTVLSQVSDLDYESMEETFANLKLNLNNLQTKQILEDTILRKKRGFIQKLFGPKEEVITSDTIDIYASEEYQGIINSRLDSIANQSKQQAYSQKLKEYTLQRDHQDIQANISALLVRMEKNELDRIRNRASTAKNIAESTSRYISMFSVVIPILLLITLSVLIIYILRTKKHQEALDSSRRNALKLAKEKEQFLANMSHEIRTPMNAIGGFAKILLKGKLNNEQVEYLRIIDKSTEHLTHILNDVLDFSKLQSGKIKLEQKTFKPYELIADTIKLLADKAQEKNLHLDFEAPDLPEVISGDPYRLRQILLNLIHNGIKFTDKGGVYLTAKLGKKTSSGVQLIFEVMDTGHGIPQNRQKHIFNEFEQINREDKRKGTGLGLSITKKLVTIHKGSIAVKSTPGKGSIFSVKLPYQLSDVAVSEAVSEFEREHRLEQMHVLIADDEEFNRKLLIAILKEHDVTFDVAIDGAEAYEHLSKTAYDIVLLDFRMPEMDGPEVAEKIKNENGINANTPIIGLTATVSDQDMEMAKNSGIQHVLRKPFDTNELLLLMNTEKDAQNETSINQLFSLEGLKKMGDNNFVTDMVETFISSTKENLRQLDALVENENWNEVGEVLHKIIAPARHLKADSLVALLKEHERSARTGIPIPKEAYKNIKFLTLNLVESLELHLQKNGIQ